MNKPDAFDIFRKEAPEVAKSFDHLIKTLMENKGLDSKTKQLVYIGIKAALGHPECLAYHVPLAKKSGVTRDELKDTILLSLLTSGAKGIESCLPEALDLYDKA